MWKMCEIRERRRRLTHERVCAIETCQPRDGQIQLTIQQSRVPTMTMTTRFCTRRLTHERTKQSAVYEDTGNSSPRKSNFPELVERRRHRTGDCRKQGRRGRPEEVISQINHIFLYSSGQLSHLEIHICCLPREEKKHLKYRGNSRPKCSERELATRSVSNGNAPFPPRIKVAHRRPQPARARSDRNVVPATVN